MVFVDLFLVVLPDIIEFFYRIFGYNKLLNKTFCYFWRNLTQIFYIEKKL